MNLLKFFFMQLYYLIEMLFMQLSYILEYVYGHFRGLVMTVMPFFVVVSTWVGGVYILVVMTCTLCRLVYGKDATSSKAGRLFVLGVEWFQCLFSLPLEWHGRRMIKCHQELHRKSFSMVPKDRPGILRAQEGIIQWIPL